MHLIRPAVRCVWQVCGISTDRSVVPLQEQNESAAILKIKESMQEEAKRFEKDDHPDYNFMAPW